MLLGVALFIAQLAFAFAQYPDANAYGSPSNTLDSAGANTTGPAVPMAPPRVPAMMRPSFRYRPPPPPVRRDEKSEGQCTIDESKWRVEPQSAVANAIMFDRTTGLSCDECLGKCIQMQGDPRWVCRTVTYDHRWKVCDLFAVNGTAFPHFLTHYPGRDYFEYLLARTPTDEELVPPVEAEEPADDVSGSPSTPSPSAPITSVETKAVYEAKAIANNAVEVTEAPSSSEGAATTAQSAVAESVEPPTSTAETKVEQSTSEYQAVHRNVGGKTGANLCDSDDVTRYATVLGKERSNPGSETQFVDAKTPEECAKACDRDELFTCISAVLTTSGCELSTTRADHNVPEDLTVAPQSSYLEKVCLQAKLAESTSKLWPVVENHILVGHVLEVTDASTFAECQLACLRAEHEFAFVCRSAMWYPADEDQNCLLNSESRVTQPDVFVAEDQGVQMVYFDVPRDSAYKESNAANRFRDDPMVDEESSKFTRWSSCDRTTTRLRHRYLKCKDRKDVRKCPKETAMCGRLQVKSLKGDCVAVRDSLGRKRCPHGIRQLPSGQKEYCKNPTDCS